MKRKGSLKYRREANKMNGRVETVIKEVLGKIAEASYQVALKLGFRGTFITFLSDLEEALHEIIRKDQSIGRPGRKNEPQERHSVH